MGPAIKLVLLLIVGHLTLFNKYQVLSADTKNASDDDVIEDSDITPTISAIDEEKYSLPKERRYLLYDVNMGEGFNLRRDVYMRVANLVRQLREKGQNFILVLPPWGGIYHWQTKELREKQYRIPWSLFFDIQSLNRFVPVIEFEDFLKETGEPVIDHVYYLQHYSEGWGGSWKEKLDYRPCIEARMYYKDEDIWKGWFFGYQDQIIASRLDCISIQGQSSTLVPFLLQSNQTARSIMIDRAETILHDYFGDKHYWAARRSMRYSASLRKIGDDFREEELESTDDRDQTLLTDDWREMKPKHGTAVGGPYLCIHWRRKDFVRAHGKELPSIEGTATQIAKKLKELELDTVFVATDAPKTEMEELKNALPSSVRLTRYIPTEEILHKYMDGGVSIIDQWICDHARYFIGSHVSTFSFRIQDDREILGFSPVTTFNRLCPDTNATDCEQPAKWTIKY